MNLLRKLKSNGWAVAERNPWPCNEQASFQEDLATNDQQRLEMHVKYLTEEVQNLQNQVLRLEQELDRQKRLKTAFKLHAGNLGDYLKACLQALEDKGVREHALQLGSLHGDGGSFGHDEHENLMLLKKQAQQNGWYISESEIELCNDMVGSGATSSTYRGIWRGLEVAVKCIRPSFFDEENSMQSFCRELEMLLRIRHPNVVQFLGACMSPPDHAWIVMECMSSGTLTEWLHGSKKRPSTRITPLPPLHQRLQAAISIAQGMQYMHESDPKVLHRDLKPSNVFMHKNGDVRIADFGFAKLLDNGQAALTGETGTYIYMAPEVVRHEPYNEKCDVYSFGVLLCELITGVPPYIDMDLTPPEIAFAVARGSLRPSFSHTTSNMTSFDEAIVDLASSAWSHQPANRPSFAEITHILQTLMVSHENL